MLNIMYLSASTVKQLSMIAKVNDPFKSVQVVLKKSLTQKNRSSFTEYVEKSKSSLIYVHREYDGSERYLLLYPCGVSIDMFPSDDSIIFLV